LFIYFTTDIIVYNTIVFILISVGNIYLLLYYKFLKAQDSS